MANGNTNKDGTGTWYALLVDSDGRLLISGAAAEDAAVDGSPVLVGGRYDAAARTLDDGDAGALALDAAGRTIVSEHSKLGHSITRVTADGDIKASAGVLYAVVAGGIGVTAGDKVDIEDDTTEKITLVFSAANETLVFVPPVPITFATSIHVDVDISGGSIAVSGVYD